MSTIKPGPKAWTLRFKIHKTTILLYVEPNQTLAAIKTELLTALRESSVLLHVQGRSSLLQIPESIDDIQLAKMVELDDQGIIWERIDDDDDDEGGGEYTSRKGKGKALAGKGGRDSKETAQSVGLTNGSVVAMRFDTAMGEQNGQTDGDDDDWDVVLPSQENADDLAEVVP